MGDTMVLKLLLTPRWLFRHALLVAALAVCWYLGRWQLGRALDRDSVLNWSYAVEWFLFAGFAVLCWGWFLRDELRGEPAASAQDRTEPVQQRVVEQVSDDEDPALAAYNRMLAELHRKATS